MGILCGRRDKEESSAPSTNRRTRSVRVSLLRNVNTATVAVKPVGCDLQQLALVLAQVSRPLVAVTLDKLQQGFRQRQPSVSLVDRHAENLPAALIGHEATVMDASCHGDEPCVAQASSWTPLNGPPASLIALNRPAERSRLVQFPVFGSGNSMSPDTAPTRLSLALFSAIVTLASLTLSVVLSRSSRRCTASGTRPIRPTPHRHAAAIDTGPRSRVPRLRPSDACGCAAAASRRAKWRRV